MSMGSRETAVLCVCVGLAITSVSALRLCLVILGTPQSVFLEEYPRLAEPNRIVAATTTSLANSLVSVVNDPMLVSARMGECATSPAEPDYDGSMVARCVSVVDAGMRGSPASGELWTYKADALAGAGDFGPAMQDALRRSYRAAPREGWIAAGRVILGSRLFPLLPADLQSDVLDDLRLVLPYQAFRQPLVDEYVTDPALRQAAVAAVRRLSAGEIEQFTQAVKRRLSVSNNQRMN